MKTFSLKSSILAALVVAAPCIGTAASVSLTPTSGVLNTTRWQDTTFGNSNPDFLNFVASVTPNPELYKQNYNGAEEKALAGSYTTVFSSDAAGAITYNVGNVVGPTAYIGFKDGNHNPYSYLFNLTALGWTGTEQISFSGFWPEGGAISHVSLFGVSSRPPNTGGGGKVPDGGTTVAALGFALLGLGSMRKLIGSKA